MGGRAEPLDLCLQSLDPLVTFSQPDRQVGGLEALRDMCEQLASQAVTVSEDHLFGPLL